MENQSESIRELLLSRLPRPENLAAYREQVASLLAQNEKRLRRNRKTIRFMWIFVVASAIFYLYLAGAHFDTPQGNWFMAWVCLWVLLGAIEVGKYEQNRGRVELLKEVSQIQLQVLELQDLLRKAGPPASGRS